MTALPASLHPSPMAWPIVALLECLLVCHELKRPGLKIADVADAISLDAVRVCIPDQSAVNLVHNLQRTLVSQHLPWRVITHGEFFRLEEWNRC